MNAEAQKTKVAYLLGAGASHACVSYAGSAHKILMKDLSLALAEEASKLIRKKKYSSLSELINDVVDGDTDFEHLITFLDDSPSLIHRQFAVKLRVIFRKTLQQRLRTIKKELDGNHFQLYAALLDMYKVENCPESLHAILTTNYDDYIEDAIKYIYGRRIDLGIDLHGVQKSDGSPKLLKLHGSFRWQNIWPIHKNRANSAADPLWVPPGIQKTKARYPFNLIWGRARELLDCDLLRVIGCQLSASDWDLISLLFTTRHAHAKSPPYVVEVIDSPGHAYNLKKLYPYLDVRSILEIEKMDIGAQLVGEFGCQLPERYDSLSSDRQEDVLSRATRTESNWFGIWLEQMAEAFERELEGGTRTRKGEFSKLLGEP